jgi:hypothetical protein
MASLSHKNMTTIYPTAVPSGGGERNSDLDATQRDFDVYEAYQRALTDEEVSLNSSIADENRILIQRHPDIPPSSGHSIAHGARYTF